MLQDFTAKLSGYDVTKLARGRYPRSINPPEDLVYAPWVGKLLQPVSIIYPHPRVSPCCIFACGDAIKYV